MKWTPQHDVFLCRELLLMRPWTFKPGTKESGHAWTSVAQDLNNIKELKFTVNQKSVRDHTKLLLEKYNQRMKDQENESGGNEEPTELDVALFNIKSEWNEAKERYDEMTSGKIKEIQKSKDDAEAIRTLACENLSETRKRKSDDESSTKNKRNTGAGTQAFLMAKLESDNKWREKELELRRQAMDRELAAQNNFSLLLEQQRQLNANQQEQNKLVLQLVGALVKKNNCEDKK